MTGHHGTTNVSDVWLVKLSSSGSIQWQKSLGGTGDEGANTVRQTSDGGYIISGGTSSNDGDVTGNHGSYDCWLIKLNGSGSILWQKPIGGTNIDASSAMQQTMDGGYIVGGGTLSNDGDVTGSHSTIDYWIVKVNNVGTIQWQKSVGGTSDDLLHSIQQTADGGYITVGQSSSNDGDVSGNHGNYDYWVVKLNPYVGINESAESENFLFLSPSPATNQLTIENGKLKIEQIEIYNTLGEKVFQEYSSSDIGHLTISVADLPSGIYFIKVTREKEERVAKFVKQ